jgi:biopolymer transport protein ExbB/TolQ
MNPHYSIRDTSSIYSPALIFYNHFTHRVKECSATLDDFALEFLNIAERNFT